MRGRILLPATALTAVSVAGAAASASAQSEAFRRTAMPTTSVRSQ